MKGVLKIFLNALEVRSGTAWAREIPVNVKVVIRRMDAIRILLFASSRRHKLCMNCAAHAFVHVALGKTAVAPACFTNAKLEARSEVGGTRGFT